jgi:L-alanine-DL-glutamate epimerase-like enolase superfamily enzyme
MNIATRLETTVDHLSVAAYRVPTDYPEADGTLAWDHTMLVLVELRAGDHTGLGYTYADGATAHLIEATLADVIEGRDPFDIPAAWAALAHALRNLGRPGICAMAISAVDSALWDLKARLLDVPLVKLLGAARDAVPIYGSGGFTSYPLPRLQEQLGSWVARGIPRVKMKVGANPAEDLQRVQAARAAIGAHAELFVDANGAYSHKQALAFAERYAELDVVWFEEPVSSDDLEGLRLLRDRGPAGMEIAAGEYGYELPYFQRMLEAGAVDVLQADATRCGGITGLMQVAPLCVARSLPLSAHCAPALHAHVGCALPSLRHVEYFHDHARIESLFFDGALTPQDGTLRPDLTRPGLGLELKRADAERYLTWASEG